MVSSQLVHCTCSQYTRKHELFFAPRLLAVTALEVPSVLGINFGREGVRVALLGGADGLVAHIRELLRVLAVGATAVFTHHQRRETLTVSTLCAWDVVNDCTVYVPVHRVQITTPRM